MTNDLLMERLTRLEEKLDRVTAFQEQLSPFIRSYESLSDLGRELSLLTGPGVSLLTEELAEVETGGDRIVRRSRPVRAVAVGLGSRIAAEHEDNVPKTLASPNARYPRACR